MKGPSTAASRGQAAGTAPRPRAPRAASPVARPVAPRPAASRGGAAATRAGARAHRSTPARGSHAARPVRAPRRVSGPVPHAVPAGAASAGTRTGTTGAFERLRALPDHRVVDRLLRSRAWIWLVGIALGGIVAMQVSLLELNSGISRAVESAGTLERQNAELEAEIAKLSSGERIRGAAAGQGLVTPPAGAVEYVVVRPGRDVERALGRIVPPSAEARQVVANGGLALAPLPEVAAAGTAPAPAPADPATAAAPADSTLTSTVPADPATAAAPADPATAAAPADSTLTSTVPADPAAAAAPVE